MKTASVNNVNVNQIDGDQSMVTFLYFINPGITPQLYWRINFRNYDWIVGTISDYVIIIMKLPHYPIENMEDMIQKEMDI